MTKTSVSAILICHNEEKTLADEIQNYFQTIISKIPNSELIIAEDGSTDDTRKIIYQLAKKLPLQLVVTSQKRGYAKSLRLALKKAKGDIVFYADAGGKHDPNDFWKLYKKRNDYDFISGYKAKRNDPTHRLFLAWGLNKIVNFYFGISFKDIDCGFKLLSRKAVKTLLKNEWILKENISLEIVLTLIYQGFIGCEMPIKHFARKFGPSRGLPPKKIPRVILSLLAIFPTLKSHLNTLKRKYKENDMVVRYNKFYPTGKYRLIWEGKISVVYKLPKFIKIIKNLINSSKPISILELGSGDGEIAKLILSDPFLKIKNYTASDLSKEGVVQIKKNLKKFKNSNALQINASKIPFKNDAFDIVLAIDVMHHALDPKTMGNEMVRVARKKVFLLESNGLSLARRIAELKKRYKEMGEKSYLPGEYRYFLSHKKVKKFEISPFLFMIPHIPEPLIPFNIAVSELLEKIPLVNWQCTSVMIKVELE